MAQSARKPRNTPAPPPSSRPAKTGSRSKMETLASFVRQMSDDEIWNFVDALVPGMSLEDKEDLWGAILIQRREQSPARPFREYLSERAAGRS